MCEAVAGCIFAMAHVAAFYLTYACHAQRLNRISGLNGVVFPAGLKELDLVSFCYCKHLFRGVRMSCGGGCGMYGVRLCVLRCCI